MTPLVTIETAMLLLFAAGVASIGSLLVYPIVLRLLPGKPWDTAGDAPTPAATLIVVVRNGADLIEAKLRNSLEIESGGHLQILAVSDGSTDETAAILERWSEHGIECVVHEEHLGKIACLNDAVERATGSILVFSDADALLERHSLRQLLRHFSDARIGGVCGQRCIHEERSRSEAQSRYIGVDSHIKVLESRSGSLTSNDGKLYAVRRELYTPIPEAVTDDLFAALSVVRAGRRFVFEPDARALIRLPSRSSGHEIERRRRIVGQSLHGIWRMRGLLNPLRRPGYALRLFTNKILRRLLPFALFAIFVASAVLARFSPVFLVLTVLMGGAILGAFLDRAVGSVSARLGRLLGAGRYALIGLWGTAWGVYDFVRGRPVAKWDPQKGS